MSSSSKITFPPEWEDAERMSYLLSPFPPSAKPLKLNDPKFSFWSSLILSSSKELHEAITSVRVLKERFCWKGRGIPGCLPEVLEGMERSGDAMKVADFYRVDQSWLSWGADVFVKRPVSWALKSYLPGSTYEGEYVINCVAKDSSLAVLDKVKKTVLYKSTDSVMKSSDFEKLCLEIVSKDSVGMVKWQLLRDGKLARKETEFGYEVVKLSLAKEKGSDVTDVDIGIVRIKESIEQLSYQIRAVERAVDRLRQSAKEKVHAKDKKAALRLLRHCAAKKSILGNKESMLDNLQEILHKIQSAETDATVYEGYKIGLEALRSMRKSQGLTLEKAEDITAELKDLAEEGEEISAALGEVHTEGLEDRELLKELEELMDQDKGETEGAELGLELAMSKLSVQGQEENSNTRQLLDQLPPVPSITPAPLRTEHHERTKPQLA